VQATQLAATAGTLRERQPPVCRSLGLAAAAAILLGGCSSGVGGHTTASVAVGCSTLAAPGRPLAVKPVTVPVDGHPTAFIGTADCRWAFASVSTATGGQVDVMTLGSGQPRLVRTIDLPAPLTAAFGLAITHDGQFLLVAGYTATAVLRVAALEDGNPDAIAGLLADAGAGKFEVAVSRNDQYAFVTDETSGGLSVFDLATVLQHGFAAAGVAVGIVPLAPSALGVAMSPDGRQLYVTTFGAYGPHGELWVLDTARAETAGNASAVVAQVAAGCQPLRVVASPDGRTVWVTALQSNALLGFSVAKLRDDPAQSLAAVVRVGSEPVGLVLVDDGRIALVANSNRGLVQNTGSNVPQTVTLVSTASALAGRPAVLGAVPAGLFPRDLNEAAGKVLLWQLRVRNGRRIFDTSSALTLSGGGYSRSGAVTPSKIRPFPSTIRAASASHSRARPTSSIGPPSRGSTRQASWKR
jgi:DNA-binding beta-propeller fold protein YncE